jgi:hypothetical protein
MEDKRSIKIVPFIFSSEFSDLSEGVNNHEDFACPLMSTKRNHYLPCIWIGFKIVAFYIKADFFSFAYLSLFINNIANMAGNSRLLYPCESAFLYNSP